MKLACLLMADDLTGACDAGVQFAGAGRKAWVEIAGFARGFEDGDVLAVSTQSRDLSGEALRSAIQHAVERLPVADARILFKKIDSLLRGNVAQEVAIWLDALGCDAAVITPAFPAMGRTVCSGWLRVERPGFEPIALPEYWSAGGLASCRHVATEDLETAIARGSRFISVDAVCDEDLDYIVNQGRLSGRRILWAGSAGLAAALARTLRGVPADSHSRPDGPVRFCIGSDHAVTQEQVRYLREHRTVASAASAECVRDALGRGEHVLVQIPRGTPAGSARELLSSVPGPLFVSGGDTASLVCHSLDAGQIELIEEIAAGVPRGRISRGLYDGAAIVTKSGAFGESTTLVEVADYFLCPKQ